ncbi:hypothetical protein [Vibrio algivorus]|uniref:M50 family metallopeptidase n=1 Tax=Vibrio algivorus TaxID=1667024 RepID=A0ABQ6EKI8_9VIBR|nr:hypothetical protein [Vibrio algivorus]GLT13623.1 hypothetical protein GCM10007931_05970 [Vibrio algivorus]
MIGLAVFLAVVVFVIGLQQVLMKSLGERVIKTPLSKGLFYLSAMVGTPIHEASHALVALIFGHKVHKISWFQMGKDGRLGYVNHNWNQRSLYQSIGVFFIAIAPLLAGFSVIVLLQHFLVMPTIRPFILNVDVANVYTVSTAALHYCAYVIDTFIDSALSSRQHALTLLLACLICFHCIPSRGDFNNALKGSVMVLIVVAVLWVLSFYFNLFHQQWMLAAFNFSVNVSGFILATALLSMGWWIILVIPTLFFRR